MEPDHYIKELPNKVFGRVRELRGRGVSTSKGEKMSLAAIARTMEPAPTRTSMYDVVYGRTESARIKAAIERELIKSFWIKKRAA